MIWNNQLMKSSLNEFCKKTVCVPNVMTICSQCTLSLTPENITLFWMSLWRASLQYGLMCDIQIYLHFCFKIKQLRKETGKKLHNTLKNWVIVTLAYIKQKKDDVTVQNQPPVLSAKKGIPESYKTLFLE